MMITRKIAESIIEKNKPYAPEKAKVILVHEDGRAIFAEKFEQGVKFWYADTMRESTLQGIIHKLTLVAKRNDQGDWVGVSDFSTKIAPAAPKTRQERILEAQENLRAARASKPKPDRSPVIKPAVVPRSEDTAYVGQKVVQDRKSDVNFESQRLVKLGDGCVVTKFDTAVEPFKPDPAAVDALLEEKSEFISLRELEPPARRRIANELFVSFRPDGKIILCKALRDILPWTTLNMMVTRDFKRFGIMQGKDYNVNQSGTYVNRAMCSKLTFPEDAGTIRVVLQWDEKLNMYVGEFQ